jgi:hypothetical protein
MYPYAICFTDGTASTRGRSSQRRGRVTREPGDGCPRRASRDLRSEFSTVRGASRNVRWRPWGCRGSYARRRPTFGAFFSHTGLTEPYPHAYKCGRRAQVFALPIDALTGVPQDIRRDPISCSPTSPTPTGCPEVPQIASDGTLRALYLPAGYEVAAWASNATCRQRRSRSPIRRGPAAAYGLASWRRCAGADAPRKGRVSIAPPLRWQHDSD